MPRKVNPNVKSSRFNGVSYLKISNKWVAQYKHNGKTTYLGCFLNEIDAAYAYDDAKREAIERGELPMHAAKLNFPGRPNGYTHARSLRCLRNIYRKSENKTSYDPFRCKNITYYTARNVWKVSYCYHKKKFFVGAYGSQENAIRAGLSYLEDNADKFNQEWLQRTANEHRQVLELLEMIKDPEEFALPPLMFSRPSSPTIEELLNDDYEADSSLSPRWNLVQSFN